MKKENILLHTSLATLLIAGFLLLTSTAHAANKTKHINVADTELVFEIPSEYCFLDRNSTSQQSIHSTLESQVAATGKKRLLLAWISCSQLSKMVDGYDMAKSSEKVGYINWLNPEIGPTYDGTREQFLAMLSRKMKKAGRDDFKSGEKSMNTSTRYSAKLPGDKVIDEMSVTGYTLIRNIPVEIKIKDSTANFSTKDEEYKKLNSFINYQIKINE